MMPLGKTRKSDQHMAEVFHFVWDGGCCSWATFTIIEQLGEFAIISDCGNYSYRWNRDSLGSPSLKDFLPTCHASYVVEKFSYSNKTDLNDRVDYSGTRKEWRKAIGELYAERNRSHFGKQKGMTKEDVKDLLRSIDLLLEDEPPADIIFERMGSDLWLALGGEPYDFLCHERSPRYVALNDHILPFFFNWLKEQGHGSRKRTSA